MTIYKIILPLAMIINPVFAIDKAKVLEIIKAAKSHKKVVVAPKTKLPKKTVSSVSRDKTKKKTTHNTLPYASLPPLLPTSEILKIRFGSKTDNPTHSIKIKARDGVNRPNSYAKNIEF